MKEPREVIVYIQFAGAEWECELKFTEGYGPIRCSDPSDPRFSDPGQGDSLEILRITLTDTNHDLTAKEMKEFEDVFGVQIEQRAFETMEEEDAEERDREWRLQQEEEEYQRCQYNDYVREQQLMEDE